MSKEIKQISFQDFLDKKAEAQKLIFEYECLLYKDQTLLKNKDLFQRVVYARNYVACLVEERYIDASKLFNKF